MPQYDPYRRSHRILNLAHFAASISWAAAAMALASRAARGLAVRLQWSDEFLLLEAMCLVFLLVAGFALLQGLARRGTPLRETIGLPRRRSAGREWATGAALGWGVAAVSVFTMAVAGALDIRFWFGARALWLALLNLATVALFALASEIAFRGYPYRRLVAAIGPSWATLVMAAIFALFTTFEADSTYLSAVVALLLGVLLGVAWLRTHGLWLGWGVHLSWSASLGILFGLPVAGVDNLSSLVQTRAIGPLWLTGGDLGPEGALSTPLLLLAGILVLVRVSRDWAWHYTHPPIVAAGYPMDVAPPAAHAAMEARPARTPALVQILPTTSQARSVESETR